MQELEKRDSRALFPTILPWQEDIVPGQILDEIAGILLRYVVLEREQADAAALWISHTYFLDVVDVSPIAIINAPERACAKTLFQTLLARLSYRPLAAANASAPALFRIVESARPTIFFDEADTFLRSNPDLQGMVNAGYKRGGFVLRCEAVGDSFEARQYAVYSAKSIAGIALERHLSDATSSRGIWFNMRRKMRGEIVERYRNADSGAFDDIASKLARFAADYSEQVKQARPHLPEELGDRAQDNWEALLAIAECAGAEWEKRATDAALTLSATGEASVSLGNELLSDIRDIFANRGDFKISSADLIDALAADSEGPWATYNRGRPLTQRQLAKILTSYSIKSKTVRIAHGNTPKGYDTWQFSDAFARYLPQAEQAQQPAIAAENAISIGGPPPARVDL